jgi:hypothetical protein
MQDRDAINSQSMYMGDEAFLELLDRVFDTDPEKLIHHKWKKMDFSQVRTLTGMSNLTVNSKAFIQAKNTLHNWSKDVSGRNPESGIGRNARMWYYMPPLRVDEDPPPPDKEDIITGDERTELEKEKKRLIKQQKLIEIKLKQLNKKETQ